MPPAASRKSRYLLSSDHERRLQMVEDGVREMTEATVRQGEQIVSLEKSFVTESDRSREMMVDKFDSLIDIVKRVEGTLNDPEKGTVVRVGRLERAHGRFRAVGKWIAAVGGVATGAMLVRFVTVWYHDLGGIVP